MRGAKKIRTFRSHGRFGVPTALLAVSVRGENYHLGLTSGDGSQAFFTSRGIAEVDWAAKALNRAADDLALTVADWSTARPERRRADVEKLRSRGREMASAIFQDGGASFASALTDTEPQLVVVQWPGPRTGFPWQLLWIEAQRKWLGELAGFAFCHPYVPAVDFDGFSDADRILAAYAEDDGLASARRDVEREPLRGEEYSSLALMSKGTVSVAELETFTAGRLDDEERDTFDKWLSQARHIYHFAAHSTGNSDENPLAAFLVRRGAEVTSADFRKRMSPGAYMLNICSSGVGARSDSESLANLVLGSGARGGIATTNRIADRFGTLFARTLYRELERSDGRLFIALRTAQAKFIARDNHPMALFYMIHGDPNFTLRQ